MQEGFIKLQTCADLHPKKFSDVKNIHNVKVETRPLVLKLSL
jgi:hypothetical protein